jgi:hypothetical protein
MSFGLAPPPTPLQLHDLHLTHREKKDEEREEIDEEAVIFIMEGVLKVETFPTTTKKHGFLPLLCFINFVQRKYCYRHIIEQRYM